MDEQEHIVMQLDLLQQKIADANRQLSELDQLVKSRFVEMFGNVCEGLSLFELVPVEVLCNKIIGGGTPSMKHSEYYEGGNIPWLKSGDIKSLKVSSGALSITKAGLVNSSAKMIPAGSIIVVTRSGILKHSLPVAIASNDIAINQDLKALIPSAKITSEYLLYALLVAEPLLLSKVRATTADNIETSYLKNLKLPLPPLKLQQEFSAFVALVDKTRSIAQQQVEKLQTLYDSLAQDYFC